MTFIAIDLGDKRCGIAISREGIAFPRDIVKRTELISWLKKYFQDRGDVSHIIVGLPYDLYGIDTRQLDKTQRFMLKLQGIFPNKVIVGHDERFSSFQASEGFREHRDDVAAQCILQSYLDSVN